MARRAAGGWSRVVELWCTCVVGGRVTARQPSLHRPPRSPADTPALPHPGHTRASIRSLASCLIYTILENVVSQSILFSGPLVQTQSRLCCVDDSERSPALNHRSFSLSRLSISRGRPIKTIYITNREQYRALLSLITIHQSRLTKLNCSN